MLKDNLIEVEEHIKKACKKSGRIQKMCVLLQ